MNGGAARGEAHYFEEFVAARRKARSGGTGRGFARGGASGRNAGDSRVIDLTCPRVTRRASPSEANDLAIADGKF